ncbi:MAG: DNA starvation/stationary phase protection protein [Parabacteroides sp.]|nr:DNA starvation/stationary phase protection protein [Parabacteroides sp.]
MDNQNTKTKNGNAVNTLDYIGLPGAEIQKITDALQQLLADYQVFYANLRGFHWHVQGKQFFTLHVQLEKMYNTAAEIVDEIAERILTLGAVPENKFSAYLEQTTLKEVSGVTSGEDIVKHILEAYKNVIKQERDLIELADKAGDEGTSDMLTGFLKEQEKLTWMLCAYLTK